MQAVARRIVDALPTASGPILVRDRCGRADFVNAVVRECERRKLDPVVEHVPNAALRALIRSTAPEALARWDLDRTDLTARVSGLIVLGGWLMDMDGLPVESVDAWAAAVGRVEQALEARHVPTVVVAVPAEPVAQQLGMTLDELDAFVIPALLLSADDLRVAIGPLLGALAAASQIQVSTDAGVLTLHRETRPIMVDDGVVDSLDIAAGAVVSNLPAGSVYWTVVEEATRGDVALSDGTILGFDTLGRVREGKYSGERVSHVGIATNPLVSRSIGWTIVDEHRPGAVFLALGENRYMGGQNESTINVDLLPISPTVVAGSVTLVDRGQLVIQTGA